MSSSRVHTRFIAEQNMGAVLEAIVLCQYRWMEAVVIFLRGLAP